MSWLNGFNNRFKLTIPADSVDSSLTNFPVMINLSSGAGKNNFDATSVFDELGDNHQKRFAITKNDGTTQCPVEIEYWDAAEEKAVLWTKIPTVYSSVDTDIYYYWDVTTSGNTSYVGDVGDTVAQNVWDSSFKLVMHMAQDPNGDVADAIKDSTINANHGTPGGAMTSADLIDGKIGKAIDFDGNDFVGIGNNIDITTDSITLEAIVKTSAGVGQVLLQKANAISATDPGYAFYLRTSNPYVRMVVCDGTDYAHQAVSPTNVQDGIYHYVVGKWCVATHTVSSYVDTLLEGETTNTNVGSLTNNSDFEAGRNYANGSPNSYIIGLIDEVRISNTARSVDWIKATYYSNWDNFIVFQQEETTSWLSDWSKRIKLTIDKDKIDSTLVDFPINITLDSDTGITNTDVTDVFTTISGGSKKIAITTNDGITQCYVEIERWDEGNEQANLWTKVPSVSSNEDTILYLYYDSSKSDNTSYVGDIGDSTAQNVWNSNFKLVMHMAQDPNGDVADAIKDSTSNANHGTPAGTMTSADLVDGKIGKAIDFDGDNDLIDVGDVTILDGAIACTLEFVLNRTSHTTDGCLIRKWASGQQSFVLGQNNGDATELTMAISDTGATNLLVGNTTDANVTNSNPVYTAGVWDGGNTLSIYENITAKTINYSSQNTPVSIANTTEHLSLGGRYNAGVPDLFTDGLIDEVRISNIARSAAWIKTTYYSNWDGLVSFGSEQEMPTHYYYGYITEDESPVSRTVRLYYRDTGVLMSDTTSNADTGYYYLTTSISGEHFIVTIDDDAGKDYNALILDRLLPRGIE